MRGIAAVSKARWDKEHGVFIYDGAELPPALAPFRAQPYSWEMHVQRELAAAPPRKPSPPHASIPVVAHSQRPAIACLRTSETSRRACVHTGSGRSRPGEHSHRRYFLPSCTARICTVDSRRR